MSWTGSEDGSDKECRKNSVWRLLGKRPSGKSGRKTEDNVKTEISLEYWRWTELAGGLLVQRRRTVCSSIRQSLTAEFNEICILFSVRFLCTTNSFQ